MHRLYVEFFKGRALPLRGIGHKTCMPGRGVQKRLPSKKGGIKMAATYGRKFKGASRRVPITVHAPLDRLDAIDEYVEERRRQEGKAYSRSDFYEEAAALYLEKLGRGRTE